MVETPNDQVLRMGVLNIKDMIITIQRNYGAHTDKAFCTTNGNWIPRKFALDWNKDKPPQEVLCDVPEWMIKKYNLVEHVK